MIKNYIITALRNIWRNRSYSIINFVGLCIGISVTLMVFIYTDFQKSYDKFHEKKDRIFRINRVIQYNDFNFDIERSEVGPALSSWLLSNISDTEDAVRIHWSFKGARIKTEKGTIVEKRLIYADPSFFNIFSFKLIEGDPINALKEPFTAVITRNTAKKYFGTENPMGKYLGLNPSYKITGIVEAPPANSHINFDIIVSFSSIDLTHSNTFKGKEWESNVYTYVLTKTKIHNDTLNSKLKIFSIIPNSFYTKYKLKSEALTNIFLYSKASGFFQYQTQNLYLFLYFFQFIAIVILMLACYNFISLTTARSINRSKEIAIRKISGSNKLQIVFQLLIEFLVTTIIAILISILIVELATPLFSQLAGKKFTIDYVSPLLWKTVIILMVSIPLLAGLYPAIIMSRFNPVSIFNSSLKGRKNLTLRRILIVIQLSISFLLILIAIYLKSSVKNYFKFDNETISEKIANIELTDSLRYKRETIIHYLKSQPEVDNVTSTSSIPGITGLSVYKSFYQDKPGIITNHIYVNRDFFQTIDVALTKGIDFPTNEEEARTSLIVSKDIVKDETELPLNEYLKCVENREDGNIIVQGRICGYCNSYVHGLKYDQRNPAIFSFNPGKTRYILCKFKSKIDSETLKKMNKRLNDSFQGDFIEMQSLSQLSESDEMLNMFNDLNKIIKLATFISLVLSLLGLYSLAAFIANNKTKEFSIRRVMGASNKTISFLIIKDTIILMLVAITLTIVPGKIVLEAISTSLPNLTSVDISVYIYSVLLLASLGILSVLSQIIKAIKISPVDTLKYQ